MLSPEHKDVLRKYGFNSPNAERLQRLYSFHTKRAPHQKAEIEAAWKLAHSKEYKNHRVQQELHRRRMNRVRANISNTKEVQGQKINFEGESRYHNKIASAMTQIAGAIQDIMASSGSSLAITMHRLAKGHLEMYYTGDLTGHAMAAGRVALRATVVAPLVPQQLFDLLKNWLLRNYNIEITDDALRRACSSEKVKGVVDAILAGRDTDVRPLISAVVYALDPAYVKHMGQTILQTFLDTYVKHGYKPGEGESTICKLCTYAAACKPRPHKPGPYKNPSPYASRLFSDALKRVFLGLNRILELEGTNVTQALRQAIDANIAEYLYFAGLVQASVGPMSQVISVATSSIDRLSKAPLSRYIYKPVSNMLQKYGLGITASDLDTLTNRHLARVAAFISRDPHVDIEPFIVDLVVQAKPLHLLSNVHGAAVAQESGDALCKLCSAWTCPLRKVVSHKITNMHQIIS